MLDLRKVRHVGLLEQYSTTRNHLGFFNNVAVTASYSCPQKPTLDTVIYNALTAVIAQQPCLSTIPVDEGSLHPYFAQLPSIDLHQAVTFLHRIRPHTDETRRDEELDEILQAEHSKPFKLHSPPIPFWRLIILRSAQHGSDVLVSFIFHHALADTKSAMIFHKLLAAALSATCLQSSSEAPVRSLDIELPPPLEEGYHSPISVAFVDQLLQEYTSATLPDNLWTGNPRRLPVTTCLHSVIVPASDTLRFVRACRANRTTLTAALQTLIAATVFSLLPKQYTKVSCDSAVCLRRFLPARIDRNVMGCFVGSYGENYRRGSFSWAEAERSHVTIRSVLAKGHEDVRDRPIPVIKDWNDCLSSMIGKKRGSTFEISNIGILTEDEKATSRPSTWRIRRLLFTQSAGAISAAFKINVATGPDGRLNLSYTWQQGIVGDDFMENLIKHVYFELIELGN